MFQLQPTAPHKEHPRRHGEKANSILSPQYQIPTPGAFLCVPPWPRVGSLGCSCSTRRSSPVTTDNLTEKVVCVGDSKLHLSPDCYHKMTENS